MKLRLLRKSTRLTVLFTVFVVLLASTPGFTHQEGIEREKPLVDATIDDNGASLSAKERALGVRKKRHINLDVEAFRARSKFGPVRSERAAKPVSADAVDAGPVSFAPLQDLELQLEVQHFSTFDSGVETFSGTIKDVPEGHFVLSVEGVEMSGQISLGKLVYEVYYDRVAGSHAVKEIDLAARPVSSAEPMALQRARKEKKEGKEKKENGDTTQSSPQTHSHKTQREPIFSTQDLANPSNGNVRILVLYPNTVTGIDSLAANIITSLNDALRANEMDPDLFFTLAGTRQLAGNLNAVCRLQIMERMENATFPFINIQTWINNFDADVVLTVGAFDPNLTNCPNDVYGNLGGIAADFLNEDLPYAMVFDDWALGDYTAAHEIGHVLGGQHTYVDLGDFPDYSNLDDFGRGYAREDLFWQTVMGGYDVDPDIGPGDPGYANRLNCAFDPIDGTNQDCIRILKWSDPTSTYNGQVVGEAASGSEIGHDMARALDNQMPIAADWEGFPGSAPSTPTGFDVRPEFCFGYNSVEWNTTSGATEYQAFRSFSPSFSNPKLVYQGSSTAFTVIVSSGQNEYYKVRACNGNGCSSVTSQDVTSYTSGCL